MFHKKSYSQTFCDIHRETPVMEPFFNKVEAHQTSGFIRKTPTHNFLVNFGKFIRTPILKKISKWLHFWIVFCENIFSDQNLAKGIFDELLFER